MGVCTIMSLASGSCGRAFISLQPRPLVGHWRPLYRIPFTPAEGASREFLWGRHSGARLRMRAEQSSAMRGWGEQRTVNILTSQATTQQTLCFAEAGLLRESKLRTDPDWLELAFRRSDAILVPVLGSKSMVKDGKAVYLSSSSIEGLNQSDVIFLGVSEADGVPIFTVDMETRSSTHVVTQALDQGAEWVDVKNYGPLLSAVESGLLAYARGMLEWHIRHKHCGRCGTKVELVGGGHELKCTNTETCGRISYPRMDPAVIMLITCGDYALLGRQARWDLGRYSLLAGFVEIGETFEMAVAREVKEESGINVDLGSVRYATSQPWPFPSSLMVGFLGVAECNQHQPYNGFQAPGHAIPVGYGTVTEVDEVNSLPRTSPDVKELEDARWVHRSFLKSVLLGEVLPHGQVFTLPGKHAVANYIMQTWIASDNRTRWAGTDIQTVDIDEGTFKYVLISIKDDEGNQKLVIRGRKSLSYHSDILEDMQKQLRMQDIFLKVSQLGGGRIDHDPERRTLHVFSSSQAFGQADHTVTSALLRQIYPFHTFSISWDP